MQRLSEAGTVYDTNTTVTYLHLRNKVCNGGFPPVCPPLIAADIRVFTRAELREHDPVGYKMVQDAWGVRDDGKAKTSR